MLNTIPGAMMDREQHQIRLLEAQRDWHVYAEGDGLTTLAKKLVGRGIFRLIRVKADPSTDGSTQVETVCQVG